MRWAIGRVEEAIEGKLDKWPPGELGAEDGVVHLDEGRALREGGIAEIDSESEQSWMGVEVGDDREVERENRRWQSNREPRRRRLLELKCGQQSMAEFDIRGNHVRVDIRRSRIGRLARKLKGSVVVPNQ